MFFTFFQSPFWRSVLWIGSFLTIKAFLGFEVAVITALAIIAMRQRENKAWFI